MKPLLGSLCTSDIIAFISILQYAPACVMDPAVSKTTTHELKTVLSLCTLTIACCIDFSFVKHGMQTVAACPSGSVQGLRRIFPMFSGNRSTSSHPSIAAVSKTLLYYSTGHCPHSQPMTDECAGG